MRKMWICWCGGRIVGKTKGASRTAEERPLGVVCPPREGEGGPEVEVVVVAVHEDEVSLTLRVDPLVKLAMDQPPLPNTFRIV